VLLALSHVGETDEMRVQDASAFAACREELSYWELMVRVYTHSADSKHLNVLDSTMCAIGFGRPLTASGAR